MTATGATPLGRHQFTLRRMFLYLHIVAVVCAAFLGTAQILTGWDDDCRALLTAAVVAAGSICGLVCGAALESRRARITPIGGLVLTIVGLICTLPLIWSASVHWGKPWWEWWLRVTLVICTIAVSESHIALLSFCRLTPRYLWAKVVAIMAILAVAGCVIVITLADFEVSKEFLRWTVVAAIVDAAMTILIPVFHLLSRKDLDTQRSPSTMPAPRGNPVGRMFLYLYILAVGFVAFIASAQTLTGWDDDLRALLTAATLAAGSICGLICGAALKSRRTRVVSIGGLAFTLVGVVSMLLQIWTPWGNSTREWGLRLTLFLCTVAASLTHILLLSFCRLASRYRWAKGVGVAAILAVAGLVISMLWIYYPLPQALLRWTTVAAIVDAAMSILIPVFHLLSRKELGPAAAEEAPLPLDARPALKLPQFSLRTLLILTAISAAFLGLGRWSYKAQQQRATVDAMRSIGGQVRYDFETSPGNVPPYWPTWLVNALGVDYVATVSAVDISDATDADLRHLKELTSLREVHIHGWSVTDAGLENLKGLTKLQTLSIGGLQITDAGLEQIQGLTSLETLYIGGEKVTDAGLEHLKGLTSLRELDIRTLNITDAGLEHLKGLRSLKTVYIGGTKVTDVGVRRLHTALPNIRTEY